MRFNLAKETSRTAFATRASAAELRAHLTEIISTAENGALIDLDLSGVEAMTVSFADELVAKLVLQRHLELESETFFVISNASPEVLETIEVALQRRKLFVAHKSARGEFSLCAGSPHLRETFRVAVDLGEFTASQLARELEIKLPAANNRIRQLAEAGVLIRNKQIPVHGGREYLYKAA